MRLKPSHILITFFFAVFAFHTTEGQKSQSVWLDENFQVVSEQGSAVYKRILVRQNDSVYSIQDFHIQEDFLYQKGAVKLAKLKGSYSVQNAHVKHGYFEGFHPNGNRAFSGTYLKDKEAGEFHYWYENGLPRARMFFDDSLEMDQESLILDFYDSLGNQLVKDGNGEYHEEFEPSPLDYLAASGKCTRIGKIAQGYKDGEWVGSFFNGKSTYKERYKSGQLIEGISIDSTGQKYRYQKLLQTPDGLQTFYQRVASEMKYPQAARRLGIQGRVYVQFIVDQTGIIDEVKTVKGIHPDCDAEAERVIRKIGQSQPCLFRGIPIRSRMVLPIIFKLS